MLLALDSDSAGHEAMLRAARVAEGRKLELRVVALPQGSDPADIVGEPGGAARLAELVDESMPFVRFRVERALATGNLRDAEGKDEVIAQLRPVFATLPPSVLREELLALVADRLSLSPELLASLLAQGGRLAQPAPVGVRRRARAAAAACAGARRAGVPRLLHRVPRASAGRRSPTWTSSATSRPSRRRRLAAHLRDHGESGEVEDPELAGMLTALKVSARSPEILRGRFEVQRLQLALGRVRRDIDAAPAGAKTALAMRREELQKAYDERAGPRARAGPPARRVASRVMPELAFEDFTPGRVFDLGTVTADREEMIEFARRYDPQPFHIDEEAGRHSVFGGLCASGWYTSCLWMRAFFDSVLSKSTSKGSPGGTEFGWPRPMFPGDVVQGRMEVLAARESRSRPDARARRDARRAASGARTSSSAASSRGCSPSATDPHVLSARQCSLHRRRGRWLLRLCGYDRYVGALHFHHSISRRSAPRSAAARRGRSNAAATRRRVACCCARTATRRSRRGSRFSPELSFTVSGGPYGAPARSGVAQWQSIRLLIEGLWVRVPPPELENAREGARVSGRFASLTRRRPRPNSISTTMMISRITTTVRMLTPAAAMGTSVPPARL